MAAMPRAFLDEADELAVLAVAPGSRVALVGGSDSVAAALTERGCQVDGIAPGDLAGAHDPFDAVLVHAPAVSPDVLGAAAERLATGGRVVVTVANVTHGAVRLALLQGRFPAAGEGPVFDRHALDRLFADARLVVLDRVEVRRPLDEVGIDIELDAFKPELLAALDDDPEALVAALVYVGRLARDDSVAVVSGAGGLSLAEELQGRLRRAELESIQARADADSRRERVRELEDAVRRLQAELDDLHGELAHARMDLELKDAFSNEMRALADEMANNAHHTRLEAQALQRSVDHLQGSLLEAHALLAGRTGELAVAQAEFARIATELDAVTQRAAYQIASGMAQALDPLRPVFRVARGLVRGLRRLTGRTAPPTPGG